MLSEEASKPFFALEKNKPDSRQTVGPLYEEVSLMESLRCPVIVAYNKYRHIPGTLKGNFCVLRKNKWFAGQDTIIGDS